MRRQDLAVLKVVRRNPLPLWMLLGSGSPGIEEVVDALECSAALPRYFSVFAQRILQLYI